MALSPQALIKGIVARALPTINADGYNQDVAVRMGSYGELAVQPLVRKAHMLADEGSYYVCNNAQTGIVPTYSTSFSATTPLITIYNGNVNNQRLYLDYISLVAIAAGANTTTAGFMAIAITIDNINRYTSGGTVLTSNVVSPNMALPANTSGAVIACGAITAASASAAARTIVGIRNIRPTLSSTVTNVAGDTWVMNFGGVENTSNGQISITASVANIIPVPLPPVIIPPGSTMLLHYWTQGVSAPSAATYAPEIGFWVR
jgi:hypothetical protein